MIYIKCGFVYLYPIYIYQLRFKTRKQTKWKFSFLLKKRDLVFVMSIHILVHIIRLLLKDMCTQNLNLVSFSYDFRPKIGLLQIFDYSTDLRRQFLVLLSSSSISQRTRVSFFNYSLSFIVPVNFFLFSFICFVFRIFFMSSLTMQPNKQPIP